MQTIIDFKRYPLDRFESIEAKALIHSCQQSLETSGLFSLEGFIRQTALNRAVAEVTPVIANASFTHNRKHNVYFLPQVEGLAPDHPALKTFDTTNHTICADQIPGSVLMQLYSWPGFARFLAAVMNKTELFVMDDPLAAVNVMAYRQGEALNWHFDRSEFTTTLLLQASVEGGEFEYRSNLRSARDPNYEGVAEFLDSNTPNVSRLPLCAGTLNVFRGRNTLHRVSPVAGDIDRLIAVFSYYETAGVKFSREEQIGFYGRSLV